jgi:hypothetical protein
MGRASRKREAQEAKAAQADRDQPRLDELRSAPTRNPIMTVDVVASSQTPESIESVFQSGDATTVPPLPATTSTGAAKGQTHAALTPAAAVTGLLTGDVKPRVLMLLLVCLGLCLISCLWMLKTDNDLGRLIWPNGYWDFGIKVLAVTALYSGFVAIGLIGYSLFHLFRFMRHLSELLWQRWKRE